MSSELVDSYKVKEDDDFITSYNKFMMEKMHYLETTIETIQTLMEYHNYTIETIMGQIDEMKDLIVKIEKEQNRQRIEKEKEMEEKRNEEMTAKRQAEAASKSLNRKDSLTTVSTALNDESALLNNTQISSVNEDTSSVKANPDISEEINGESEDGEPKPEQGSTSLFDEIYNSEEANVILDEFDNNTDFLRICKTVDFLVQDAYTAIMYIPTSNVPITSSMAYYTTKYRAI